VPSPPFRSLEFPAVTLADWRAQVDRELAGKPFEKALAYDALDGVRVGPLYTDAPAELPSRSPPAGLFRICMRHGGGSGPARVDEVAADIEGGADALWLGLREAPSLLERAGLGSLFFVFDVAPGVAAPGVDAVDAIDAALRALPREIGARFALNLDPIGSHAKGPGAATLAEDLLALGHLARLVADRFPAATASMVSTLPYHDAGADAADEIAIALSTGVRYLERLLDAGLPLDSAATQIAVQVAAGRDTFLEICKLRALRTCWGKVLSAAGAGGSWPLVHAVCSSRTLAVRDPWVNMLRATTQVFSAVLGGADLVTPNAFDQALGAPSAHGRRVARNTGLVLREESSLGKVADPAGGSYCFDTLTDALGREAWRRFRAMEAEGGITVALESGRLAARLEATWHKRLEDIAKRKVSILGVSEFANLDEKLPPPAPSPSFERAAPGAGLPVHSLPVHSLPVHSLPVHRDAEAFESLRTRADATTPAPEAWLVTLGTFAESRPRVGFASGFLAAGGIRTRETRDDAPGAIACLCGTDDRYAAEAVARARSLKAAGCEHVLLAGRPGALGPALREAGVDGFLYVGCDAVALLSELLGVRS
jgi:methylmalonyl-CoA mutase